MMGLGSLAGIPGKYGHFFGESIRLEGPFRKESRLPRTFLSCSFSKSIFGFGHPLSWRPQITKKICWNWKFRKLENIFLGGGSESVGFRLGCGKTSWDFQDDSLIPWHIMGAFTSPLPTTPKNIAGLIQEFWKPPACPRIHGRLKGQGLFPRETWHWGGWLDAHPKQMMLGIPGCCICSLHCSTVQSSLWGETRKAFTRSSRVEKMLVFGGWIGFLPVKKTLNPASYHSFLFFKHGHTVGKWPKIIE